MNNEMELKLNKIIAKTINGEINWVQENTYTFYTVTKDPNEHEIQMSIQYINHAQGASLADMARNIYPFLNKPKFVFQIKNISSKEVLYKADEDESQKDFQIFNKLYTNIKQRIDKKASEALDNFL